MKILVLISLTLCILQIPLLSFGKNSFPTKSPIGGKTWGTSVKEIGNGIFVFRWWVYRNIFIITDEGVIATDPINPKAAALLKKEIQKRTDKPVKYVVYSHNHKDHISGGNVFKKDGAKFVGHANLLKELKDHPNPSSPLPDITFKDSYKLKLGGRVLELKYFGPNHGNSLIVMRFPKEKILFIVDIVTPRRVAFRTMPDFWPDEWIRSLKEIEKLDFDYVISGHGPETQPAIDGATIVKDQREYLEDLMKAVKNTMDKGTHDPNALKKMVKLPKYKNWRYYKEWLPMNIERIWAYYHMGW
ncbi:MAG: MBL fold metallo-hydrolase [Bdellovibrionaceae bacterium]|jgi:glyoxylase-like metal-dependent hydrolase (beta-lactamase superfamily II)|nr:MBL fold metallo-hydrolase [Pseudobdellovibrionaceae bacterium]